MGAPQYGLENPGLLSAEARTTLTLMSCGAVNTGIALRLSCLSVSSCSGRVSWWSRKRSCSAIAGDQEQTMMRFSPLLSVKCKLKTKQLYRQFTATPASPDVMSVTLLVLHMTADLLSDPGLYMTIAAEKGCRERKLLIYLRRSEPQLRAPL